jgi:glutamate dehydrogenase (NADP+)
MTYESNNDQFLSWLKQKNPGQPEFIQAAKDIANDIIPIINAHQEYKEQNVLYRLAEPDRIISFKVVWQDDNNQVRINKGWRVQQSNLLGPYKGGLRFHPSVNESILKFLAFEQCFKNALTGLSLGGAKGGSDFNPKGCTDSEIMRFCNAFMTELSRHIGPNTDVPAGDINVGQREIGFLFGQYRRLKNQFTGTLTGKELSYGGSEVRQEATGYGVVYFTNNVLSHQNKKLENQKINISGAGNVALFAAQKALSLGASVNTLSNSKGTLYCKHGLDKAIVEYLTEHKDHQNPLKEAASEFNYEWLADSKPWAIKCDVAMPCATQNELDKDDAADLVANGTHLIVEGANMPLTEGASDAVKQAGITYVPGKASNAGGVTLSGFEMEQNGRFDQHQFEHLEQKLEGVMQHIHKQCLLDGQERGGNSKIIDYARGANVAGFRRLADAMVAQGY